jgi:asparagine synthase (glutamine-hydrolysing)
MCGIFATSGGRLPNITLEHRGPDAYSELHINKVRLAFWRLAINGLQGGMQPIQHGDKYLIANAEIYNHTELGGIKGESDCNVILKMVDKVGLVTTCKMINGDFAFVITDGAKLLAARDRVGVRPLYYCKHSRGIAFASEVKALLHFKSCINHFPPGHLYSDGKFVCWETNHWDRPNLGKTVDHLHMMLWNAVKLRVTNTEVPVGFFLSGGLDSSIVAAIGKQVLGKQIRTFAIGLEGAPDLIAARQMATFLDSNHTEVIFTPEEGLDVIEDVIWHLETFDTTTVRASIPMFLLSKYIKENTDIRVILSGEGSDELFGGYLYFHGAPTKEAFAAETERLVNDVYMFDVLRADRTTSAHGIELRVPFFDPNLINYVMGGFDQSLKMPKDGYEKHLLRTTFENILPHTIAWRQKNGMSDAVGYKWRDALKKFGEHKYKDIFTYYFGYQKHLVPYMWMPKWCSATDPSATQLPYFSSYQS